MKQNIYILVNYISWILTVISLFLVAILYCSESFNIFAAISLKLGIPILRYLRILTITIIIIPFILLSNSQNYHENWIKFLLIIYNSICITLQILVIILRWHQSYETILFYAVCVFIFIMHILLPIFSFLSLRGQYKIRKIIIAIGLIILQVTLILSISLLPYSQFLIKNLLFGTSQQPLIIIDGGSRKFAAPNTRLSIMTAWATRQNPIILLTVRLTKDEILVGDIDRAIKFPDLTYLELEKLQIGKIYSQVDPYGSFSRISAANDAESELLAQQVHDAAQLSKITTLHNLISTCLHFGIRFVIDVNEENREAALTHHLLHLLASMGLMEPDKTPLYSVRVHQEAVFCTLQNAHIRLSIPAVLARLNITETCGKSNENIPIFAPLPQLISLRTAGVDADFDGANSEISNCVASRLGVGRVFSTQAEPSTCTVLFWLQTGAIAGLLGLFWAILRAVRALWGERVAKEKL